MDQRDYAAAVQQLFQPHWLKGLVDKLDGSQGMQLRYGVFPPVLPEPMIGHLVLIPGQGEFMEKYQELIYDFCSKGWRVYFLDHRGQGGSQRYPEAPPRTSHVKDGESYVDDLEIFMNQVVLPGCGREKPFLVSHSMGGAIAVRYLQRRPGVVAAAALMAPMLGIVPPLVSHGFSRRVAKLLGRIPGLSTQRAPGAMTADIQQDVSARKTSHCRERVEWLVSFLKEHPELEIDPRAGTYEFGAAAYGLVERLWQPEELRRIATPILICTAAEDAFVCNDWNNRFAAGVGSAQAVEISHEAFPTYHELYFETDPVRERLLGQLEDFFQMHLDRPQKYQPASSAAAKGALNLVKELQESFYGQLCNLYGDGDQAQVGHSKWLRRGGSCGGGDRYFFAGDRLINRGAINVSQVHYEQHPEKKLASATALSTIIHPQSAAAPSVHIHISWTEFKDSRGYWRIMADLNPAVPNSVDTQIFRDALGQVTEQELMQDALHQGERYFFIPALERHRGVVHFYLEQYGTSDPKADAALAAAVGRAAIDCYVKILRKHLSEGSQVSAEMQQQQLDYHTLYFFQVLTLDRGTTAGLLVHDENDLGIMGSLPRFVSPVRLREWAEKMPEQQRPLLEGLLTILGDGQRCEVDDEKKVRLAKAVRSYYQEFPQAMALQAKGTIVPQTVHNHCD